MNIKKYKLYLIDLDGTIYNGEKEIKYAKEFIEYLNNNKIDYLFLTNNSTKEPKDVVKKLYDLGIQTSEEHVYTSSEATKAYLIKKGYKDIYIIGEKGLKETLSSFNQHLDSNNVEAVIVGLDRELTYKKLTVATRSVLSGAELIGTNPDTLLPTAEGFIPSNGGQIKYLEHAILGDPAIDISFILYRYIPQNMWGKWLEIYGQEPTLKYRNRLKWYITLQTVIMIVWFHEKKLFSDMNNWLVFLDKIFNEYI